MIQRLAGEDVGDGGDAGFGIDDILQGPGERFAHRRDLFFRHDALRLAAADIESDAARRAVERPGLRPIDVRQPGCKHGGPSHIQRLGQAAFETPQAGMAAQSLPQSRCSSRRPREFQPAGIPQPGIDVKRPGDGSKTMIGEEDDGGVGPGRLQQVGDGRIDGLVGSLQLGQQTTGFVGIVMRVIGKEKMQGVMLETIGGAKDDHHHIPGVLLHQPGCGAAPRMDGPGGGADVIPQLQSRAFDIDDIVGNRGQQALA